jgi:hypothetical protein
LTYNRKRDKWIVSNGTATLAEYNSSELRMALVSALTFPERAVS